MSNSTSFNADITVFFSIMKLKFHNIDFKSKSLEFINIVFYKVT